MFLYFRLIILSICFTEVFPLDCFNFWVGFRHFYHFTDIFINWVFGTLTNTIHWIFNNIGKDWIVKHLSLCSFDIVFIFTKIRNLFLNYVSNFKFSHFIHVVNFFFLSLDFFSLLLGDCLIDNWKFSNRIRCRSSYSLIEFNLALDKFLIRIVT